MENIIESWSRISKWLEANASDVAKRLPGPAEEHDIEAVEEKIGLAFPEDLKASYLVQNGVEYGEDELNIVVGPYDEYNDMAFCLLPIEQIADEWQVWKDLNDVGEFEGETGEPDNEIVDDWWSNGWIPIAGDGGGDFICIDMNPANGGTVGQVIYAPHDAPERSLLASSWSEYLQNLADEMERGNLEYDEDNGLKRISGE